MDRFDFSLTKLGLIRYTTALVFLKPVGFLIEYDYGIHWIEN